MLRDERYRILEDKFKMKSPQYAKYPLFVDNREATVSSDGKIFPYSINVMAVKKDEKGKNNGEKYYLDNIHTKYDTVLDMTNIDLIVDCMTDFIKDI